VTRTAPGSGVRAVLFLVDQAHGKVNSTSRVDGLSEPQPVGHPSTNGKACQCERRELPSSMALGEVTSPLEGQIMEKSLQDVMQELLKKGWSDEGIEKEIMRRFSQGVKDGNPQFTKEMDVKRALQEFFSKEGRRERAKDDAEMEELHKFYDAARGWFPDKAAKLGNELKEMTIGQGPSFPRSHCKILLRELEELSISLADYEASKNSYIEFCLRDLEFIKGMLAELLGDEGEL
jgi:hypothetical protein